MDRAGHISMADWIDASTDEEAVQKARALRPDAHKCEVWEKNRLVAKIGPEGGLQLVDRP
jgi:hypothetical protein